MKKALIIVLISLFVGCGYSQNKRLNLDFEIHNTGQALPVGWIKWGDYTLSVDSISHSGSRSGRVKSTPDGSFGCFAYHIPAKYSGKSIKLEGYIKTESVEDGFAGLLLRIDDKSSSKSLAFSNMRDQNLSGTNDWKMYSISFDYPENAGKIYVGGILTGKGEAWFDNFTLTIDGKDILSMEEAKEPVYKALLDKEFDNGTDIAFPTLNNSLIDKLELSGRVWGFLKYHHPAIAQGNHNWDYELFRFLTDYIKKSGKRESEELLLRWIESLEEPKKVNNATLLSPDAHLKPDLSWINDNITSKALKEKLYYIYTNRNQGDHFYIGLAPGIGNPVFKNENSYSNMPYPDAGFRLLALYRYWNIINYYFPYKHLTDKNWNSVLKEYIPVFIDAKSELEYELAALKLIGEVHDTHANLWGGGDKIEEWKGSFYPPFAIKFIEDKLVVTDYFNPEYKENAGLEIGDVIIRIDGRDVESIVNSSLKYYPASNLPTKKRDLAIHILRSPKSEIEISYIQNGVEKSSKLQLYQRKDLNYYREYRGNNNKSYRLLDNNIGYITLMSIKDEDIAKIKEEFKDTKGIIIDIRNYPSTFVPFKLGSFFVSSSTPFVKFTIGSINNPGEFAFGESLKIPPGKDIYKGKLIVIVNEITQSQAEYTALAFRAGVNTTIIGSTTAGADGNISAISLPGGLRTIISGIGVFYPDGGETQRVGIVPDIEVKPTINGIKSGRDELLERAIELILK